jgi:hypothetical protein
LNEVVDADRTHFIGLVADVVEKYPHDYGEVASLFYFCIETKVNIQVRSDQDLVEIFAKHRASRTCLLTIAYHSPSSEPRVIPDWDCGSPSTVNPVEPPFTPSIGCPNLAEPSHATATKSVESEYIANPNPMNKHVGVDDEGLYIDLGPNYPPPPPNSQRQGGSKERKSESSGGDDYSETDSDDETSDDKVEDIDDMVKDREPEQMPDVDYNKKDPPMSVGTVYSDMDAFKIALPTHAVKHEFNYDIDKSDTRRYRMNCS